MAITLSVPADLGAIVPYARLQSNLAHLMRKLIERIETMATRPNPVGERIRGAEPVTGSPIAVELGKLNADQQEAVASSLGRNATFIWGPPGTGKTQTIASIAEQLYRRGRSVLLVSHTNTAVDQAILRIAEGIDVSELAQGRVLRVGEPHDLRFNDEKNKELLLKTHKDRKQKELAARRDVCEEERKTAAGKVIRVSKLVDICEWKAEAEEDIPAMRHELEEIQSGEAGIEKGRAERSKLEIQAKQWGAAAEAARYAMSRSSKAASLDKQISQAFPARATLEAELRDSEAKLHQAHATYTETVAVGWLTRQWKGLPPPDKQKMLVETLTANKQAKMQRLDSLNGQIAQAESKRSAFLAQIEEFRRKYCTEPQDVLQEADKCAARLADYSANLKQLQDQFFTRRMQLEELLRPRLLALREWNLTHDSRRDAEGMLAGIETAFARAAIETEGTDLQSLKAERDTLNNRIRSLEAELQTIEAAMKQVEAVVIREATVVAATLTGAYLRDSIQSRRFDTVILDEASMAPIPALWVAASVATSNAVVVGDFKQLPPIVISTTDVARQWLGRDIFEVAGVQSMTNHPPHLVALHIQHRMHPQISAIPNSLIYGGILRDAKETTSKATDNELLKWYQRDWGYDNPVLLVDTGPVDAWVTSVSRGTRASRLNFLSATICADIAQQLLLDNRIALQDGERHRILIACPYRPHAKLVNLLLHEQGLEKDVIAGTAHSFQGSEADVVILDFVNDEPHWRVGLFMPDNDGNNERLLNVALTRAKRRLIIVGDFQYIAKNAKKAFIGRELIPFLLKHYPSVDARQVIPVGLAARAAAAHRKVFGGEVEVQADRIVVSQERFYSLLLADLGNARNRVVIYSPFITSERLSQIEPQLRAVIERGVRAYLVTKARGDRQKSELSVYRFLEDTLANWGVVVIHKRRMHEKLVFIDDTILWSGSLNPLSFSNTQEIMERRFSKKVVDDYARTLYLEELVREYESETPACPICGHEVIASEGDEEPFYWTCVEEDCYSRSVDQPPLTGGVIVCANCCAPIEYGEWGGQPAWRCTKNAHHHQKVARTHLRLPKMREAIPKAELRRLDRLFGTSTRGPKPPATTDGQPGLFDWRSP